MQYILVFYACMECVFKIGLLMICGIKNSLPSSKIQKKNTKKEQSKHRPLKKERGKGSGEIVEWAFSADLSNLPCALCRNQELSVDN